MGGPETKEELIDRSSNWDTIWPTRPDRTAHKWEREIQHQKDDHLHVSQLVRASAPGSLLGKDTFARLVRDSFAERDEVHNLATLARETTFSGHG